jgi:hypothetical protein
MAYRSYNCLEVRPGDSRDGRPGPGLTSGHAVTRGSTLRSRDKRKHLGAMLLSNRYNQVQIVAGQTKGRISEITAVGNCIQMLLAHSRGSL